MADEPIHTPLKYGPWTILKREVVYHDPWPKVTRDQVTRPDGLPGTYCISHMKAGVCVLALDENNNCHLTDEFHYAVGRETLECVSGGIDANEEPLATAQRELAEEIGLKAERWTDLGTVDPFTAIALSPTRLWLAEGLSATATNPDGSEIIRHVQMPLAEVVQRVWSGEITHAPSVATILKAWILKNNLKP